eukprot:6211098-Pleurochrysis_carterae.AAC.5
MAGSGAATSRKARLCILISKDSGSCRLRSRHAAYEAATYLGKESRPRKQHSIIPFHARLMQLNPSGIRWTAAKAMQYKQESLNAHFFSAPLCVRLTRARSQRARRRPTFWALFRSLDEFEGASTGKTQGQLLLLTSAALRICGQSVLSKYRTFSRCGLAALRASPVSCRAAVVASKHSCRYSGSIDELRRDVAIACAARREGWPWFDVPPRVIGTRTMPPLLNALLAAKRHVLPVVHREKALPIDVAFDPLEVGAAAEKRQLAMPAEP